MHFDGFKGVTSAQRLIWWGREERRGGSAALMAAKLVRRSESERVRGEIEIGVLTLVMIVPPRSVPTIRN